MSKLQLCILCGGQSTEHEISILSARNIAAALNPQQYEITIVYLPHHGAWQRLENSADFLTNDPQDLIRQGKATPVTFIFGDAKKPLMALNTSEKYAMDCVIPALHGTQGEDGAMQGLLEILKVAYVGSGVLGSAICMDKHTTKRILRQENLPTADWLALQESQINQYSYQQVVKQIGSPFFIKPSAQGSSVGVAKIKQEKEYLPALRQAFKYDTCVLLEACQPGREIEVSVLGNNDPVASIPGEIITSQSHDFYSYTAKYLDPEGAQVVTPAELPAAIVEKVQEYSIRAYKALNCEGMARVDFFVDGEKIVINELNTIPGFTNISMYPKNWMVSGLSYSDLLNDLIQLAITRHRRQQAMQRMLDKNEIDSSREVNERSSA